MKKINIKARLLSLALALVFCLSIFTLASCKDPLQAQIDALDSAFVRLGTYYIKAYAACEFAGTVEEHQAQFDEWKNYISNAKGQNASYLDYSGEELTAFAEEWNATADQIRVLYEQYTYETTEEGGYLYPGETTSD